MKKLIDGLELSRDTVVVQYKGLVHKLARRLSPGNNAFVEDLTQVGFIGLLDAFDRYDGRRGVLFYTFASRYIYGRMLRENYAKGSVYTPVDVVAKAHSIERAGLWESTNEQIAEQLGFRIGEIRNARIYFDKKDSTSLDQPNEDGTLDTYGLTPFAEDFTGAVVAEYFSMMNEREKCIVRGLMKGYTQSQIALSMNTSQQRVGQIMKGLREKITNAEVTHERKTHSNLTRN